MLSLSFALATSPKFSGAPTMKRLRASVPFLIWSHAILVGLVGSRDIHHPVPNTVFRPARLMLRGGIGSMEELRKALDESRRELSIDMAECGDTLDKDLWECSALQRLQIKGGLKTLPPDVGTIHRAMLQCPFQSTIYKRLGLISFISK
jgi:hypothetical protein